MDCCKSGLQVIMFQVHVESTIVFRKTLSSMEPLLLQTNALGSIQGLQKLLKSS